MLELDLLQVNVICFKIRFCSTSAGWTVILYSSSQSIIQYCKCELIYIALLMIQFERT